MEQADDDQRPQPQLEMPQHDKASTFAAAEETATTTKTKQLSDESDAGEPEENYRGWKSMPYVIGELTTPTTRLHTCMSITRSLSIEQSFIHSFL